MSQGQRASWGFSLCVLKTCVNPFFIYIRILSGSVCWSVGRSGGQLIARLIAQLVGRVVS